MPSAPRPVPQRGPAANFLARAVFLAPQTRNEPEAKGKGEEERKASLAARPCMRGAATPSGPQGHARTATTPREVPCQPRSAPLRPPGCQASRQTLPTKTPRPPPLRREPHPDQHSGHPDETARARAANKVTGEDACRGLQNRPPRARFRRGHDTPPMRGNYSLLPAPALHRLGRRRSTGPDDVHHSAARHSLDVGLLTIAIPAASSKSSSKELRGGWA